MRWRIILALAATAIPAFAYNGIAWTWSSPVGKNVDQHPPSTGNHNRSDGSERCYARKRRWNSARDDLAGFISCVMGARFTDRADHV